MRLVPREGVQGEGAVKAKKITVAIDPSTTIAIPYTRGVNEWIANCCTMATRYLELYPIGANPEWVVGVSRIPIRFCPWCKTELMRPTSNP